MSNIAQKPTLLVADDEAEIGEIFRALTEDLSSAYLDSMAWASELM